MASRSATCILHNSGSICISIWQGSLSDWKTWKMGRHFQSGKSPGIFNRLEKSGKIQGIWDKYYLIFLVIFKWTAYYLLKWINFSVKKTLKILEKWKKYWKSEGKVREFCQSGKVGTMFEQPNWQICSPLNCNSVDFEKR